MDWYYAKDGVQHGPTTEGDLRTKLESGELSATDLVWRDGMAEWQPASEVAEFAVSLPAPEPASESGDASASAPSMAPSPYQTPQSEVAAPAAGALPVGPPPEGSGKATASLVLGICGLVGWCIPCIGLILGILAVVYGGQVMDAAKARAELEPYIGKAKAGRTMGFITIALSVLNAIAGVALRVSQQQ